MHLSVAVLVDREEAGAEREQEAGESLARRNALHVEFVAAWPGYLVLGFTVGAEGNAFHLFGKSG